jgi:flavin reductase (DIM6/NTAB) family NADH-FMN oxidoreductase RutF
MQIDPSSRTNADNYKILTNLVVPRPIAWVTSQSSTGLVNLAPFSFFNAVGSDPLYVGYQYWLPRRRVAKGYRKKH